MSQTHPLGLHSMFLATPDESIRLSHEMHDVALLVRIPIPMERVRHILIDFIQTHIGNNAQKMLEGHHFLNPFYVKSHVAHPVLSYGSFAYGVALNDSTVDLSLQNVDGDLDILIPKISQLFSEEEQFRVSSNDVSSKRRDLRSITLHHIPTNIITKLSFNQDAAVAASARLARALEVHPILVPVVLTLRAFLREMAATKQHLTSFALVISILGFWNLFATRNRENSRPLNSADILLAYLQFFRSNTNGTTRNNQCTTEPGCFEFDSRFHCINIDGIFTRSHPSLYTLWFVGCPISHNHNVAEGCILVHHVQQWFAELYEVLGRYLQSSDRGVLVPTILPNLCQQIKQKRSG